MWKELDLRMIPTFGKSRISIDSFGKMFGQSIDSNIQFNDCVNQHLYVTSDEKINEGDYAVGLDKLVYQLKKDQFYFKSDKKIISSDEKLVLGWNYKNDIPHGDSYNEFIPQIPETFVETFIEENQKGNLVTKVLVEYAEGFNGERENTEFFEKLTLNSNNEINIKLK